MARDDDRDVVVLDSPVFADVPPGMRRLLVVGDFDVATDVLVIRAPAELLAGRQIDEGTAQVRIGDVGVRVLASIGADPVDFGLGAFVFVPTPP